MKLTERLNVLIQATTLSQKSGVLTLDEAVKAKSAIDVISTGTLTQNFASAINILIEVVVASQKRGAYSLKDAYMIYLAVDGIEGELQNEVDRINEEIKVRESQKPRVLKQTTQEVEQTSNNENVVTVPPKKLKRNS
jgi:hypothetical protein